MKRGFSAGSRNAARSFLIALFRLWSKATNTSAGQSRWRILACDDLAGTLQQQLQRSEMAAAAGEP
jgi:hypothetical protein